MLDIALQFLTDELNSFIAARTGSVSQSVEIRPAIKPDGSDHSLTGSICVSIINIEEERTIKSQIPEYRYVDGQNLLLEPELKLNLYLIFVASFSGHTDALKLLSHVLTFFQSHQSFTPEVYPSLDRRIAKLSAELQSLTYEQLNQVWGFIGTKQLPSVTYKVRMVTIQDVAVKAVRPAIKKISSDTYSQ